MSDLAGEFGARVRAHRKESGLTIDVLAQRAGLSKTGVWEVENGQSMPGIDTALKLANALNVSVGSLIDGDRDRPPAEALVIEKIAELYRITRGARP